MKIARFFFCALIATGAMLARPVLAQTVQLNGTVPPDALKLPSFGDMPATQTLSLQIWFKPRNEHALDAFIAAQQDPASPEYHHWLTPDEYTRRFGVTQDRFDDVAHWLTSEGFQITGGSPKEGFIGFSGSVSAIGHTFNTRITKFSADGSKYGNVNDPELPAAYADVVGSISGLNNLMASTPAVQVLPHSGAGRSGVGRRTRQPIGEPTSMKNPVALALINEPDQKVNGAGPALGPQDFYNFYGETGGNSNGTDCIAIIGDSDFAVNPLSTFDTTFGLPDTSGSVTEVLVDGSNPGQTHDGHEDEANLDLEWSHAVAPKASSKFFLGNNATASANGAVVDAIHAAIVDGKCPVISASFALCGGHSTFYTQTVAGMVKRAQTQGQSIFVSAGDQGSAGLVLSVGKCVAGSSPNVNELASNPLITSVGGTSFDTNGDEFDVNGNITGGHKTEHVWNDQEDGIPPGPNVGATGGGASVLFAKPAFQNGLTPSDGRRDQPDVALLASPNFPGSFTYLDKGGTKLFLEGGTSISAPMWAGIVDILVQRSGGKVGSINPRIYQLVQTLGQTSAGFFDVTQGNNNFNSVTTCCDAAAGYDETTGLGTVQIDTFIHEYITAPVGSLLTPSPNPLNFGNVKVSGKPKKKPVTLKNTAAKGGQAITLQVPPVTVTAGDFTIVSTTCKTTLAAAKSCKVFFQYAPSGTGMTSQTATVHDNAANAPQMFTVEGTGI